MPRFREPLRPFGGATSSQQTVVALHCSGADGRQWRGLAAGLEPSFRLVAPDFYGTAGNAPWCGLHAFTLADEARPILAAIDSLQGKVHLVGHSYGGGVALHIALQRPEAVASLALYEPSAFHLLRREGGSQRACFAEIEEIAAACAAGLVSGDYREAAARFVDYWGGPGTWKTLRPTLQAALIRWLPKAPLDFRALIEEPTALSAYRQFTFPTLLLRGEHAPAPTAAVADLLAKVLPRCTAETLAGAGHMGPVTHAATVNARILRFLARQQPIRFRHPVAARTAALTPLAAF